MAPEPQSETIQQRLLTMFQNLLPLVDDVADKLGVLLIISFATLAWIFYSIHYLQDFSLKTASTGCIIAALPWILLLRFWFALSSLKDIPKVAEQLIDDVSEDAGQAWHAVKSGKKGALNIIGQAKKLLQIRSLLSNADDILEQYFNIGILINPISLIFAIFSLISLFVLFLLGALLAVLALF